jgi:hypothetical protein
MHSCPAATRNPWPAVLLVVTSACGPSEPAPWAQSLDTAGVPVISSPAEGDWTLQPQPRIVDELRIGKQDTGPEYQFTAVIALDVDDAGRIYVLEQQAAEVRIYDSAGRHLRSLGRPGRGPGEFSPTTTAVLAGTAGRVYVADLMRQRIVALDTAGVEIGSTPLVFQGELPVRWEPASPDRFALHVRSVSLPGMRRGPSTGDRILLRDAASERADTLLELESGSTFQQGGAGDSRLRLFAPEPVWTLLENGAIAYGRNDEFRIAVRAADGALQHVIIRPTRRPRVTVDDRTAFLHAIRRALERQFAPGREQEAAIQRYLERVDFADVYPAYAGMIGGPANTLWVQRIRTADDARRGGVSFDAEHPGSPVWDVFDAAGRLLGPLRLPDRFTLLRVRGTALYGTIRDEHDVPTVARLRIVGLGLPP